jgi:hypothetical protein
LTTRRQWLDAWRLNLGRPWPELVDDLETRRINSGPQIMLRPHVISHLISAMKAGGKISVIIRLLSWRRDLCELGKRPTNRSGSVVNAAPAVAF